MKEIYIFKTTDPDIMDRFDYIEALVNGYFLILFGTIVCFGMKAAGMI